MNIPFNLSNGCYYYKFEDLVNYANNKYGEEEIKNKFKNGEEMKKNTI
jgi:hypothetical protein